MTPLTANDIQTAVVKSPQEESCSDTDIEEQTDPTLPVTILPEHWETSLDSPLLSSQSYEAWLQAWNIHLAGNSQVRVILMSACQIYTPLRVTEWQSALSNQGLAQFFLQGISKGFILGTAAIPATNSNWQNQPRRSKTTP